MARQKVTSGARMVRHIEREIVQNQQAHSTTQTNDLLYTADDVVILKRLIADIAVAHDALTTQMHSLWVIYILPKDVAAPAFTVSDGELEYASQVLLPLKLVGSGVSDGQSYLISKDAKYSRKLQPGDRIYLSRLASADSGLMVDASMIQLFLAH